MKNKVMKTVFMIVVTIFLLFVPLSIFIGNDVMFNFFAIVGFVLVSSLLIAIVKILLDSMTE